MATAVSVDTGGNLYVAGQVEGAFGGNTALGGFDAYLLKNASNGTRLWSRQFGTPVFDTAQGVAVDPSGHVYIAGSTQYDPNSPTLMGGGALLAKYDDQGNPLWLLRAGAADGQTDATGVATDAGGNAYVAGYTWGRLDGYSNAGRTDAFVGKLDADGNDLWAAQLGTAEHDSAAGVAVDALGNVYVTGSTGAGLDGNASAGGVDAFIVKFDGNGNKLWSRQFGTGSDDRAYGLSVDGAGDLIVAGYTDGDLGGAGNAGSTDLFVAKYDGDGNRLWIHQMGTQAWDGARGVAVDADGNIYVTGSTFGGLDGNTNGNGTWGSWDLFLIKFDGLGNRQWTRQTDGAGNENGLGVATDGAGNIYAVGANSTSQTQMTPLIVKYDSAGNKLWTR